VESAAPRKPWQPLDRLLPAWAVYTEDLRQGVRHWAFLTWIALGLALGGFWLFGDGTFGGGTATSFKPGIGSIPDPSDGIPVLPAVPNHAGGASASLFAGRYTRLHLLVMLTLIVAIGATAISGELDSLDEAVLCRGIARWQYFVAKAMARTTITLGLFFALAAAGTAVAALRWHHDLTWDGSLAAIWRLTLLFGSIAVLSTAGGSWFKNPLLALASVWMLICGTGIVITILDLAGLAPFTFTDQLPALIRGDLKTADTSSLPVFAVILAGLTGLVSLVSFNRRDL
jgi:hypothetical protein